MTDPENTDPKGVWITVAGIVAAVLFSACCWFGVYQLGASPHCHLGFRGMFIC
jgi:hypothetical protein